MESDTTEWTGVVNEVKQQIKSLKKAQVGHHAYMQAFRAHTLLRMCSW